MRTTIDLPEDLHRIAVSISRDTSRSLSETVTDLMRKGLETGKEPLRIKPHPVSGFPTAHLGRVITTEDVRALEDDE